MSDNFTIRLTGKMNGDAIHPHTLDLAEVIKLLEGLMRGVRSEAQCDGTALGENCRILSLVSVTDKCAEYAVAYSPLVAPAIDRISVALCDENFDILAKRTQRQFRKAFGRLIGKGAGVQFFNGRASPVYSRSHPLPEPKVEPSLVEDSVSLLAYIVSLGGKGDATVRATFEATNETISVDCDKKIAKRMSDACCLYETVSLIGKAEWKVEPWQLLKFQVTEFEKHHKGKASELFNSLDKDFVNHFRDINVDAFMRDVRGEESQ
jgi:hypothetical protein